MFKPKQNISNVSTYEVFDNNLFFKIGESLRSQKLFINQIPCDYVGVASIYKLRGNYYFNSWKEKGIAFKCNIRNCQFQRMHNSNFSFFLESKYVIREAKDNYEYLGDNFKIDFTSSYRFSFIIDNFGIVENKDEIIVCNLPSTLIWHFPLSSIAPLPYDTDTPDTVSQIIGVASQKLWVRTEARRLLVLDIETGELLKIFSHHESDKKQGYTYNEGFGSIYIKENDDNYLYCMGYDNFQKINTKTITIQEAYDTYKEDPVGIASFQDIYSPLLQGDYFTFIGRKHGESGGIRHIGIFDYTAKKLVWQYQVISEDEIAKGNELIAPEPLYISGNKLYIKDFHQTLHIFEKEEHIS